MEAQTVETTDSSPVVSATPLAATLPPIMWTGFLNVAGTPKVVAAKYQKDLKKLLAEYPEAEVLAILRGRSFGVKVVKSFDIFN